MNIFVIVIVIRSNQQDHRFAALRFWQRLKMPELIIDQAMIINTTRNRSCCYI
jgi:hypothetical protein